MNTINFEHLKETARRAFYWTSFSPDKRGDTARVEFYNIMLQDVQEIEISADAQTIEAYKKRFEQFFVSWLNANSKCASSMITGPANFNVRKHEKANNSERNHYNAFMLWREKAKKAINRQAKPVKTFSSELERYKAELEGMKKNHELMKEGNKRIKQALKDKINIDAYLIETFNIPNHMLDWTYKFGFGLTNNNANMKRVEERIKLMERKEQNAANVGSQETRYNGFDLIMNHEADRIQIKHDSRPSAEVITKLKKNGFKWSPSQGVWQRQITQNAIWTTNHLIKELQAA